MVVKLFGTDGIRGKANVNPMTAEVALKVGMAAGAVFTSGARRHTVVIGKDTRLSGYMLEPALAAGFIGMGMDVIFVGPMPTPAVAMLVRSLRADLGVMISASHNSFEDNGIKLFGPSGYKLSDSAEAEIESLVEQQNTNKLATPNKLGRARRLEDAEGRYIEFAKNTFPKGLRLDGLKIVVDCANGAAYKVVPAALWELGSDVVALGISPNGLNINKACGSTNTELMRETVVNEGANLGIALDGDADRVILADEEGNIIDGDQILALIAKSWKSDNRLKGEGIVTTVMANLGLERFLTDLGLNVVRTRVGDRYVVEKMLCDGFNVGGEQSGHIILNDYNTTGDGLVAALEVLSVIVQSNRPASEVCRVFDPVPQILKNVVFAGSSPMSLVSVKKIIADGEKKLEGVGRLLIRQSGTESIIRVMAEGSDETMIKEVVNEVCSEIEKFSK
ncbi:MAG: phosphoglucosamine mutase [Rhodospirillaceae bacterium]|jgi:phosphoglucosamine mutase|nr:phosphoglucosamine mutase [Rhodospirillaceae bacterium]